MLIYLIYTNFIYFYYDTTALGSNYAVNEQDFRWVVIHEFERHGWRVQGVYIGNPMKHHEKYLEINEAFAGRRKLIPFINRQNNEDLILALQTAGVSRGRNGFRKDKGVEKLAETEEDLLQHRTDGKDAFDTLYIGCAKFPQCSIFPYLHQRGTLKTHQVRFFVWKQTSRVRFCFYLCPHFQPRDNIILLIKV